MKALLKLKYNIFYGKLDIISIFLKEQIISNTITTAKNST